MSVQGPVDIPENFEYFHVIKNIGKLMAEFKFYANSIQFQLTQVLKKNCYESTTQCSKSSILLLRLTIDTSLCCISREKIIFKRCLLRIYTRVLG